MFGCASGRYGTTLDYVSRTVHALRESGMPDRTLEALLERCREESREAGHDADRQTGQGSAQ